MNSILDWGTTSPIRLALTSTHVEDHEIDDVTHVVT